jgi:hypothetical protein
LIVVAVAVGKRKKKGFIITAVSIAFLFPVFFLSYGAI